MVTFKRIIALLVVLLSLIGILVMIGSIYGSWAINDPITDTGVHILTIGDDIVGIAEEGATQVDLLMNDAQAAVDLIEVRIAEIGDEVAENTVVLNAINEILEVDLAQTLSDVGVFFTSVRDTATSVADTMDAVAAIPFVDIPGGVPERNIFREVSDGITNLETGANQLRDTVRNDREAAVEEVVTALTDRTTQLNQELDGLRGELALILVELEEIRNSLADARNRFPRLVDLTSLTLTLIFSFTALAFLSLALHAWAYFKYPDHNWRSLIPLTDRPPQRKIADTPN